MTVISYLTNIRFAPGAVAALDEDAAELGMSRVLLVTDPGVMAAGIAPDIAGRLGSRLAATFADTPSNPTEEATLAALDLYREARCDGIVAVGGGSSLDLAKAVALLATHPGPIDQYAFILGGLARITPDVAPVIAVPTTAGTGSEVGRAALITLRDGRKLGLVSPHLIPRRAVCDPELTLGLPPVLTAATGMDALTHCIETFLSPRDNPPAEAIALDGAARAWRWLEPAVRDGSDREARREMMMASLEGGLTFQKGLGAVHAMSHPLGGIQAPVLHHGTLNAVILPSVLRFNAPAAAAKYDRLRGVLGLPADADLAAAVEDLTARLGLPRSLREMGVDPAILPRMVEGALADHSSVTNPRPVSAADYAALYDAAMG